MSNERTSIKDFKSFGMNTEITLRAFGEKSEEAIEHTNAELIRLEKALSRFIPGSIIANINQSAGKGCVKISPEVYEVLSCSIMLSQISCGLFDITIAPLVDLWDYKHSFHVPKLSEIQRLLPLVNFHDLVLDSEKETVSLRRKGQSIDLGGIAKGYASDRLIKILKEYGITSAFVNIGGNVSTLGNKPDGTSWCVGIRHPRYKGCLLGAVKVTDKAVVTSGDYERYFIDTEGKRWHHILDPTTGFPAVSGLLSVTVIADSAMIADVLSTAVFIAGMDKGREFLSHFPGTEAVLVDDSQQVFVTRDIKECYQAVKGLNPVFI